MMKTILNLAVAAMMVGGAGVAVAAVTSSSLNPFAPRTTLLAAPKTTTTVTVSALTISTIPAVPSLQTQTRSGLTPPVIPPPGPGTTPSPYGTFPPPPALPGR